MPRNRRARGAQGARRDRRGRGARGPLAPASVPISRTRREAFDDLVLDAVAELEEHWTTDIAGVEFAVDDVPEPSLAAATALDSDVVTDRGVALGRLHRQGVPGVAAPVLVVYRRPIEARALDRDDRADLVFMVVAELLAELLGRDIDDIAPD